MSYLVMVMLVGCKEKTGIIKTDLKIAEKPVVIEIDSELTKPCVIYYSTIDKPVKKDIQNTLEIQRYIIENNCNKRLKEIRDINTK